MFTRKVSVRISRPLDEVFRYVADARNRPQWDESVDSEELTSPEPIGVGSTIHTRMRSMGREYEYTWKIVEHDPPTRMAVDSTSGPFPTTLVFEFTGEDGANRSRGNGHRAADRSDAVVPVDDRPDNAAEPRPGLPSPKTASRNGRSLEIDVRRQRGARWRPLRWLI